MDRTWDYVPASRPMHTKSSDTNKLYACVCCALVACIVILIFVSMFNDNRCSSMMRASDGVSARAASTVEKGDPAVEVCSGTKGSKEDKDKNEHELAKTLDKHRKAFIMFYAPWCGHCVNAKPNFDAASLESELPFLKVNCDLMHPHVIQNELFNVQYFPYFVLFDMDKKRTIAHKGGHSKEDFGITAAAINDPMMLYF